MQGSGLSSKEPSLTALPRWASMKKAWKTIIWIWWRCIKMIKVGVNGYGTIGKRVADAVAMQKDMKLIGVTAHSYSFNTEVAKQKGYKIFTIGETDLKLNGIKPDGDINNLLEEADIIVDATPKDIGRDNIEKLYKPKKIKAIVQGGEKHKTTGTSFVAQCNYNEALNKDYTRIVSCNTTGLCRTLDAVN